MILLESPPAEEEEEEEGMEVEGEPAVSMFPLMMSEK